MSMSRGLFITFEGIDGCGKSTQIKLLSDHLGSTGNEVVLLREPGGTVVGEKIRNVLLDKKNDGMDPVCELLLFEAARAQIVRELIRPALDDGKIVICDRFFDSTYAYQGYARELGAGMVKLLNLTATSGLEPDITFLLDIDPEEALKRRGIRGDGDDRMEALGIGFQQKVRQGYLELAGSFDRVFKVEASGTPEEIFSVIRDKTESVLRERS